nr:hypothetical protein [uncultured Acetobacterium sp.]
MIVLESIEEERTMRIHSRKTEGHGAIKAFEEFVINTVESAFQEKIFEVLEYAKTIEYKHVGLSSEAYFAHPLRVARFVLQLERQFDMDTTTIALLHNVLEVSSLTKNVLAQDTNENVAASISLLTVNRSKADNPIYKKEYYEKLSGDFVGARIVKIFDKLDNLFLLCLNPDDIVRQRYLQEVEKYIIPEVDMLLPELSSYYRQLVKNCRDIGFRA